MSDVLNVRNTKGVLHVDGRGQRNERGMAQVRLDW